MNSNYTTQHLHEPRSRRTASLYLGRIAIFVLACILALLCPLRIGAQSYTATLLESPDGSLEPLDINDHGELAGSYYPDGTFLSPALWRNGTLTQLPLLPGTEGGVAMGLNNVGQVVGACFVTPPDLPTVYRPCIWENGTVIELPLLAGANQGGAVDINDAGTVTGYALSPVGVYPDGGIIVRQDGVVWQGGSVHALTPPSSDLQMTVQAIDAFGRVVVQCFDTGGTWVPGRWTPDVPNGSTGTVAFLDETGAYGYDINDSGVVCGGDALSLAVLWDGSTKTNLGTLPGDSWSYAMGINRAGTVSGTSVLYYDDGFYAYTEYAAFVWDAEHGMRDLNDLVSSAPAVMGAMLEARAINNAGQILAFADGGYVLLTPSTLPPPLPVPTGLSSVSKNGSVQLSWNPVTVASGYSVKRSTVSGGPYTTIATGITSNSYVDTSVVNGTRYYYVVSALADTRESANSNETTARPMAPPVAPTSLVAKATHAKVQLTWKQSTSPEIVLNRIYRSTNGGPYVLFAQISPGTSYVDYQARSKVNYTYVVTAVNSLWLESPYSNAVVTRPK